MPIDEQLLKAILPGFSFTLSELHHLIPLIQYRTFQKGEHVLREGQICRHTNYVHQGLVMYYTLQDGEIKPIDFATEGEWVAYMKSFSNQSIGEMNIVALEPLELYSISYDNLQEIFRQHPELITLQLKSMQEALVQLTRHANNLATLSAQDRYNKLVEEHPLWVQRVPQYHLAAYLGIRPQSLSRIRKNKSKKGS